MNARRIFITFDQLRFKKDPPPCIIVLHITSFAIIKIIGNSRYIKARDFVMAIVHYSFQIKSIVWLMTPRDGWNWVFFAQVTHASTSHFSGPMFQLE
jgi:hypothetical protein